MVKKIITTPFDAAKYLVDETSIAEYLRCIAEENDPELTRAALDDVARARARIAAAKAAPRK